MLGVEEDEEEGAGRVLSWNCRNSFQAENGQIFGYKRLKQFQFLIHLHIPVARWAQQRSQSRVCVCESGS